MSSLEAEAKARLIIQIREAWQGWSRLEPSSAWFVPGRVELLGKHTDYAGGRSLLCALERGFCVMAAPRADQQLRLLDSRTGVCVELAPGDPAPETWARYPAAVLRRLQADQRLQQGADMAFLSDLPAAAGMSSSSAFVVATYLALCGEEWPEGREALAAYLAAAEVGVGTHGGSEDHTAILCCQPGCWSQYRFCPAQREQVMRAPEGLVLVIAVSGVTASKAGAARSDFNRIADCTVEILKIWKQKSGREDATLAAALAAGAYQPLMGMLAGPLRARLEQFHNESDVWIPAAAFAARAGDWDALGEFVACSQAGAEAALGNQIPETTALAASARRLGAVAASSFGAGFGGSVWALVRRAEAPAFCAAWERDYHVAFAARQGESLFFASDAGPAALHIQLEG